MSLPDTGRDDAGLSQAPASAPVRPSEHPAVHLGDHLPAHLAELAALVVDEDAADTAVADRARRVLAHLPQSVLPASEPTPDGPGKTVRVSLHKGNLLKACPGTSRYHCCGYLLAHIGENCPMTCSYCVLSAYFAKPTIRIFANPQDVFGAIETVARAHPGRRFRIGTGQWADSLAMEAVTGLAGDLAHRVRDLPNVRLEFKSKAVDLSWMPHAAPGQILPAYSLNAQSIVAGQERHTASLRARLEAARTCAQAGFRVCLHFDPVIYFPGCDEEYAATAELIREHLHPDQVAYISLGSFRGPPQLFASIADKHPQARYIHEEYVPGLDGKPRLLRPLRTALLRHLAEKLARYGFSEALYLCMESAQLWHDVLGRTPKAMRGGLATVLLNRAFGDKAC